MRTPPAPPSPPPVENPAPAPAAPAAPTAPPNPETTEAAPVTLSPTLAGLRPGDQITGVIDPSSEVAKAILQTVGATFSVETEATLPPGAAIDVRVVAVGATVQAVITDIGGVVQAPSVPAELALASLDGQTVTAPTLTVGTQVNATVIAVTQPTPSLAPGDTLPLRITSATLPTSAAIPSTMTGVVGTDTASGQVTIQTPQASFAFPSQVPIPNGAKITIEVSAPPNAQGLGHPQPFVVGAKITAVVLAANPGTTVPSGKATAALAPGTPVMVRITSVHVPAQAAGVGSRNTEKSVPTVPTVPGTSAQKPTTNAPVVAGVVTGQAAGVGSKNTEKSVPTVPGTSAQKPTTNAPVVAGVVTGQAAGGGLLVRTDLGLLKMDTASTLPSGTLVEVEVLGPASRPDAGLSAPASASAHLPAAGDVSALLHQLGQSWPAMAEAIAAVQTVDPAIAQQVVKPKVPAPNLQLTNTFLMFMAALRGGDIRGWFGDEAAKTMERAGQKNFLSKLVGDIGELAKLADDTPPGEWRPMPLPFFDGKGLQQIWMFTRQQQSEDGDDEDGDQNPGTRFVIELNLSEMGGLQLDGLVQEKRFDLILRSRQELPQSVRRDLSQIMETSLGSTGYDGSLVFEAGDFPVNPLADVERRAASAGVNANSGGVES